MVGKRGDYGLGLGMRSASMGEIFCVELSEFASKFATEFASDFANEFGSSSRRNLIDKPDRRGTKTSQITLLRSRGFSRFQTHRVRYEPANPKGRFAEPRLQMRHL